MAVQSSTYECMTARDVIDLLNSHGANKRRMDVSVIEETQMQEEDNEDTLDESGKEKQIQYYVQRLKFTVAVAIIQATPPGMTPEKYAATLCRDFAEDLETWKEKCEKLEEKMLTLEQKLQTINLKGKMNVPCVDMEIPDSISNLASQRRIEPPSYLQSKISNTLDFVRSFILLGSIPYENFAEDEANLNECNLKDIVLQSVSLLFEHLRSEEGLMLEFGITKRAITEMHRLLDSRANYFERDVIALIMKFVENLLVDIYRTLDINKVTYQHHRSSLIQMIAEHRKLTPLILCRLLREITILSDSLAAQFETDVEDFTPLLRVENTYYALQATEGTLHIMRKQNSSLNAIKIPKVMLCEWDKTAEKSLLDIGAHFPMYSLYVWHVKSLLKSVLESEYVI